MTAPRMPRPGAVAALLALTATVLAGPAGSAHADGPSPSPDPNAPRIVANTTDRWYPWMGPLPKPVSSTASSKPTPTPTGSAVAIASPPPTGTAVGGPATDSATVLSWPTLGLPDTVEFIATDVGHDFGVQVPAGTNFTRLTGFIAPTVDLRAGRLEVTTTDGTFLGSFPLPNSDVAAPVPFSLALPQLLLRDGHFDLRLTIRASGPDTLGPCGPTPKVTVSGLAFEFGGAGMNPTTIDTFLPPVLSDVTFYVDPLPSPAEEQAVLSMTTALVAHYEPLHLHVRVKSLPRGGPLPQIVPSLLGRSIVVRSTGKPEIAVVPDGPTTVLSLAGSQQTLPVQVSLFTNMLTGLAQVPVASVEKAGHTVLSRSDVYTFSQLRIDLHTRVLGMQHVAFGLQQDRLGGPLDSIVVHLIGHYTPMQKDTNAAVTISVQGITLQAIRLNDTGRLDTRFRIPSQLITRDVWVGLDLSYDPRIACSILTPSLDFDIDPQSTVTVHRLGKVAGGFTALPTGFLGGFQVAFQHDESRYLDYAAQAVAGLQALVGRRRDPERVEPTELGASSSGALLVGDSTAVAALGLDPPLSGQGPELTAALPDPLKAQIPDGVGSIQAFAQPAHNRDVLLITTTGSWALVDPLFTRLADPKTSWDGLTGDVLVSGQAEHPANLILRSGGPVHFVPEESDGWQKWYELAALLAVLAVLGGAGRVVHARGRRSALTAAGPVGAERGERADPDEADGDGN